MNDSLLVFLVLSATVAVVILLLRPVNPTRDRVMRYLALRRVQRAARLIEHDHQAAKRAMNDAAGQSWRNLVE